MVKAFGCGVTSGVRNILIGTNLVPTLTTGDCNIIIGHDVDVDSSGTCTTFAIGCGTNRWITGDSSFNTTIAGIATVYGATGIVSATSFYGDGSNLTRLLPVVVNSILELQLPYKQYQYLMKQLCYPSIDIR